MRGVNMNLIEKALSVALKAHEGQKDKMGKTYILHPLRVMAKMESEEEICIALLHDVIEDSDVTADYLLEQGFPTKIVETIQCLSKKGSESYENFINRIMKNPKAVKVKCADIEDNLDLTRLDSFSEKDLPWVTKYQRAWKKLCCRQS